MADRLALALDLRARVSSALALADELGETDAAICLNAAQVRLGEPGTVPDVALTFHNTGQRPARVVAHKRE